jgi:predicted amidophosphoribosyltransferase
MPYTKVRPLLISTRARTDQVGLSANQRQQNLSGAFAVDRRGFQSSGRALVVIDDVSTTGATLASAMASLAEAGLEVAGFGVFAKSGG